MRKDLFGTDTENPKTDYYMDLVMRALEAPPKKGDRFENNARWCTVSYLSLTETGEVDNVCCKTNEGSFKSSISE